MAYNTRDDIIGEIPEEVLQQLTDDQNLGVADDTVIAKVLARAYAEVDGYVCNLYDLTVLHAAPTDFIKSLELDIAVYHLFSRRENVPENRKDRYKNAVKVLQGIAKGDIQLGVSGGAAPQQPDQTIAVSGAAGPFTTERLKNY